jgi:hypothetical protein
MQLTLALISLLVTLLSQAQISFGVKAGGTVSTLKYEKSEEPYPAKFGFNAGVLARITLNKTFFLQPELVYTQKGYKYFDGLPYKGTAHTNYIALALPAGANITDHFYVLAGPEIGFLIEEKYKLSSGTFQKRYRDLDIGLDAGIGFRITRNIDIEGRFQQGFYKVYNAEFTDINGTVIKTVNIGKNRLWQLNFMYFFARRSK